MLIGLQASSLVAFTPWRVPCARLQPLTHMVAGLRDAAACLVRVVRRRVVHTGHPNQTGARAHATVATTDAVEVCATGHDVVEQRQRRDMRARALAQEEDARRVSAPLGGVCGGVPQRGADRARLRRGVGERPSLVADDDGDETLGGQPLTEAPVLGSRGIA